MKRDLLLRRILKGVHPVAAWLERGSAMLGALLKGEGEARPAPVRTVDHAGAPHVRDFRRRGPDRWHMR